MSKKNERDAEEIDTIIHEPSRLKIMAQLYVVKEADFTFLKNQLELTWGNISSHVTKLEAAGYVEVTKDGDIELSNVTGAVKLGTASGEVKALNVILTGESKFGTASGEVYVRLSKTPKFDINLSSASGDVVLDYNGNAVVGSFEFLAKKKRGEIVSPFGFDKEEIIIKHGQKYMKKVFKRKSESPKIVIKTASGKAKLVK